MKMIIPANKISCPLEKFFIKLNEIPVNIWYKIAVIKPIIIVNIPNKKLIVRN